MPVSSPLKKLLCLALLPAVSLAGITARAADKLDFNRDIRPILSDNCFSCHGLDEKTRKAKLRLDIREEAIKENGGTQAIKPNDLKGSELWHRITTKDEDDLMPPAESNKKLTKQQIAT